MPFDLDRYSPASLAEPLRFRFQKTTGYILPDVAYGFLPFRDGQPIPQHHALTGNQAAHDVFDHRFIDDDGSPGWELASIGVEMAYKGRARTEKGLNVGTDALVRGDGTPITKSLMDPTKWLGYLQALLVDNIGLTHFGEPFLSGLANLLMLDLDAVERIALPDPPFEVEWREPDLVDEREVMVGARGKLTRRAWRWVLTGEAIGKRYYDGTPGLGLNSLSGFMSALLNTLAYGPYPFYAPQAEQADPPGGILPIGAEVEARVEVGPTPTLHLEIDRAPEQPLSVKATWTANELHVTSTPNDHPVWRDWYHNADSTLQLVTVRDPLGKLSPTDPPEGPLRSSLPTRIPLTSKSLLQRLQFILRAELPGLLYGDPEEWRSLDVIYHSPRVQRLWRTVEGGFRLSIHRIWPCEPGEALFHPHPWPAAFAVLKGSYRSRFAVATDLGTTPPADVEVREHSAFTCYEMSDPHEWHTVEPIDGPVITIMLSGQPWDRPMPVHPAEPQASMPDADVAGLLDEATLALRDHVGWYGLFVAAQPRQTAVQQWLEECFGEDEARNNTPERALRFLEEALETVQSAGTDREAAHRLVDYVFDRPANPNIANELGGLLTTALVLAESTGHDLYRCGNAELARCLKRTDAIREKQRTKPTAVTNRPNAGTTA